MARALALYEAVGAIRAEDGRIALTGYSCERALLVVCDHGFDPRMRTAG